MARFMKISQKVLALAVLLACGAVPANADAVPATASSAAPPGDDTVAPLPDRVLGRADAPVKVDEYVSLTCPHCAEFYTGTLPEIEKRYIDTGKVRFVFHDFVLDGTGLKAAQLARCMPEDEFFPFIKMIYENQTSWMSNPAPEKILISYAKLGGLSEDKAEECLKDTALQNAIVAERDTATQKYNIEATPTFVVDDGVQVIKGALPVDGFAKVFDPLLAKK